MDAARKIVEPRTKPEIAEAVAAALHRTPTVAAWDPHDVWLKRVKQPRDRRSSSAKRAAG
jgi:hypothetical protein